MFGLKSRQAEVIDHWYAPVANFQTSALAFYAQIEEELKSRGVPGLDVSRIDFSEGGSLSAKRTYLRLSRERLLFDICAAPFGTAFFFSCRFVQLPVIIPVWMLLIILLTLFITVFVGLEIFTKVFGIAGFILFPFVGAALFVLGIYVMRNPERTGFKDLDATLLQTPILGDIYQAWFRRETYYREDTRLMYLHTVNEVVK